MNDTQHDINNLIGKIKLKLDLIKSKKSDYKTSSLHLIRIKELISTLDMHINTKR